MNFTRFSLSIADGIADLRFQRPDKANALDAAAWQELKAAFAQLDEEPAARVIMLSGEGTHFSAGIDLSLLLEMGISQGKADCEGRKREALRRFITHLQDCVTAIEACRKPVLAALHGACVGGGLDIAAACDMRYASSEARLSLKEVDMAIVADLGVLQRLPRIAGYGVVCEMAYTGRSMGAQEAATRGIVNQVFADKETLMASVREIAAQIAAKSPLTVRGIKENLLHARDHSVAEGLKYISAWNAATLLSTDIASAMQASLTKQTPQFQD